MAFNFRYQLRINRVPLSVLQGRLHAKMRSPARGAQFVRHTGGGDVPRVPKTVCKFFGCNCIITKWNILSCIPVIGGKDISEPKGRLKYILVSGKVCRCQQGGLNAIPRRNTCMQRLCHRSKILPHAAGQRRGNAKRPPCLDFVQLQKPCSRSGRRSCCQTCRCSGRQACSSTCSGEARRRGQGRTGRKEDGCRIINR